MIRSVGRFLVMAACDGDAFALLKDKLLIAFWKDFHDGRKLKANCKEKKIQNTVEEYLL